MPSSASNVDYAAALNMVFFGSLCATPKPDINYAQNANHDYALTISIAPGLSLATNNEYYTSEGVIGGGISYDIVNSVIRDVAKIGAQNYSFSAITEDILGRPSMQRLRQFTKNKAGWKFGKGEVLSHASISQLESFLATHRKFIGDSLGQPSVFLTEAGTAELIWNRPDEIYALIRFLGDKRVHYYIERNGDSLEATGDTDDFVIDAGRNLS